MDWTDPSVKTLKREKRKKSFLRLVFTLPHSTNRRVSIKFLLTLSHKLVQSRLEKVISEKGGGMEVTDLGSQPTYITTEKN